MLGGSTAVQLTQLCLSLLLLLLGYPLGVAVTSAAV
jgi:hypothetical protein